MLNVSADPRYPLRYFGKELKILFPLNGRDWLIIVWTATRDLRSIFGRMTYLPLLPPSATITSSPLSPSMFGVMPFMIFHMYMAIYRSRRRSRKCNPDFCYLGNVILISVYPSNTLHYFQIIVYMNIISILYNKVSVSASAL